MKSLLLIAFIAVVLFSGCSAGGEEPAVPQREEIAFAPEPSTKAMVANFAVGDKLGILGYKLEASGVWDDTGRPEFMYNVPLERTAFGYEYSPVKFYPEDGGKVKFFAYYPYSASAGDGGITLSSAMTPGYPSFVYRCPVAADRDLLVAVTEPQNEGSVYLSCDHVLAQVDLSIQIGGGGSTYEITSLKMSGLSMSATFLFDTYVNRPVDKSSWWEAPGVAEDLDITFDPPVSVTSGQGVAVPLSVEPLLLIPQSVDALAFELKYKETGKETIYTKTFTKQVQWLPGGNYKYELSFSDAI